mgnify:CR=1 FL=1
MGVPVLEIVDLHVETSDSKILSGINLKINQGEVHALMGRNGSGKSTLALTLMGHPSYDVTKGKVLFNGQDIDEMEPFERARLGLFLSFQYPQSIPGLQVGNFLRKSVSAIRGENAPSAKEFRKELRTKMDELKIDTSFLSRYVNDGFSGGEKKRFEILQMALMKPSLAVLDETDSGLDIDALKTVAEGVNTIVENSACLIITHYQRMLNYIKPNFVHVMIDGKIVKSGGPDLALELEDKGYDWLEEGE